MNKQSFITILLTMLMSMTGSKTFAHDIAESNSDGVTIYYVWTNSEKNELAVSCRGSSGNSYSNEYSGNVVIPESIVYQGNTYSVTSIGNSAFSYCNNLTSVTIPNSIKSINYRAFYECSSLSSIEIPQSVTFIADQAFYGTAWYNNQPDGLVYIGNFAYKYKGEMPSNTNITIEDGTLGIVAYAFSGYSDLTSVNIPNSVISINSYAFHECSGLKSITIPNSVTSIGNWAFSGCSNLMTITSEITTPFTIGDILSSNKYSQTTLIVPKNTKDNYQATDGWKNFTKIVEVGDGGIVGQNFYVDGIKYTIGENNTLSVISYDSKYAGIFVIPGQIMFNGIEFTVTSIGYSAFQSCTLSSVAIPNSVTSIGQYAFSGCSSLTSVIIGSGVTSIGSYAFNGTNLKKTIWLTNTRPSGYSYASGAVNYVSNDQFTSLNNTVKYQFLSSYFEVDGIRYVPISPSERTCDAIDCVYDESAANTKIASTVLYKGVTMNVKNIQPYLAYNNKYIKTLTIDNDGELSNYAFAYCQNITSVTLGQKVSAIGSYAFQGCSSIETIDIPDIVTVLNERTFSGCTSLKEFKIKPQLMNIYNYVFESCTNLKKIIIDDSESTLTLGSNGYNPIFSSCPLDYVYIGRDISYSTSSSYGYSPFYRNTSLREVKITDKETEISENEFYGCTNLQKITIGDGVKTIGKRAFSGASSLKFFAFGSQVTEIGEEAFSDCAAMVEVISKAKTAPACGNQALDDINKFECKLYVPNGCMAVYEAAAQWKEFFFKDYAKIKLSKTKATIEKGKTLTLKATITPSDLSDKSVTWKSSNTKVATVSSAGKVKGVKVGTATITCTSNSTGLKATCKVTVENGLVTLNKTEAYVQKGKTMTLKATVSPETLTDKSVTWESSDKKIATVTKAGKVKGVKYGTATITCTSVATGAKATCQVTVGKVVVSISEVSIKKSRGITLEATVYPEDLADKSVIWKSSDKSIATVDEEGRVKGIKAGTATITCTSVATGLKGTCTVTVLSTSEARSMIGDDDELTDIKELESSAVIEPFDVYDLSGRKVLHQVTSLDGLPDGIYIVNGKKILKKK